MSDGKNSQQYGNRSRTPSPNAIQGVENKAQLEKGAYSQTDGLQHDRRPGFGWWLETASALAALCFVGAIIGVLIYVDGKPSKDFQLVKPNTLVAIFSNLFKALLLFPLAECMGQLKWLYFEKTRPLSQLQRFDAASRGPMGAALMLWDTKGRALVASLGALVTILLLAFEPFAQRVIAFPLRFEYQNSTGTLYTSTKWVAWYSSEKETFFAPTALVYVPLKTGIMSALSNQPYTSAPNYYCPSPQCDIDNVNVLGVCSRCETEQLTVDKFDTCNVTRFEQHWDNSTDKNHYQVSNYQQMHDLLVQVPSLGQLDPKTTAAPFAITMNCTKQYADTGPITIEMSSTGIRGKLKQYGGVYTDEEDYNINPDVDDLYLDTADPLRFCLYNIDLDDEFSPKVAKATCFNSTTDLSLYSNMQFFGQINGTAASCELQYCERHYDKVSIANGERNDTGYQESTLIARPAPNYDPDDNQNLDWTTNSAGGNIYTMDDVSQSGLTQIFNETVNAEDVVVSVLSANPGILGDGSALNDIPLLYERFADAMTSAMQSTANLNGSNQPLKVYDYDVYVHVQWPFMIMPFIIIVLAYVFLALSIFESRKRQYLLKTSILASMFYGLDSKDWTGLDSNSATIGVIGGASDTELLKGARDVQVGFVQGDDGLRRLRRE
ncbi:hypothetical protein K491DRAFT_715432 [Lophiostoma macrostomum CBS 122681]|uniref:Uncharacterized protein n=1 Tax=Lophiostoma macrostomum CBS 122681 TaxID=1314788 RepID=A0A6A6TAL8_9PLEO|nr:hypothetical protein K491DRAFT_715432 [Lophiostoma macrostomum CBS 122681]